MSVTITIAHNRDHARQHGTARMIAEPCCHDADCPYCGGKGQMEAHEELPFELNLANGNFATLAAAIGCFGDGDDMWCGSAYPHAVKAALRCLDTELAVRCPTKEFGKRGKLRSMDCGCRPEQVERYTAELTKIADEAERREEMIVWG